MSCHGSSLWLIKRAQKLFISIQEIVKNLTKQFSTAECIEVFQKEENILTFFYMARSCTKTILLNFKIPLR